MSCVCVGSMCLVFFLGEREEAAASAAAWTASGLFNVRHQVAESCEELLSCGSYPAIATFITGREPSTLKQFGIRSSQLLNFH